MSAEETVVRLDMNASEVDAMKCAIVAFSTAMMVACPPEYRPLMDDVVKALRDIKDRLPEDK